MKKNRISSIETVRVIAILSVLVIHTEAFKNMGTSYASLLYPFLNNVARFAIPFFLIVAGYFYSINLKKHTESISSKYKLLILFFSWNVLYALIPRYLPLKDIIQNGLNANFTSWLLSSPILAYEKMIHNPYSFIIEGTIVPLWFLSSLFLALLLLTLFIKFRKEKQIFFVAISLYVFSLFFTEYSFVISNVNFIFPNSLLFLKYPAVAFFFVSIGWMFSKIKKIPSTKIALLFFIFGFLFQELEIFLIGYFFKKSFTFNFLLGTVFYSLGVFLLCLNKPNFGRNTFLPKIARLTQGVYLSHMMLYHFLRTLEPLFDIFMWQVLFPLLLYIFSAFFVYILSKIKLTKFLVN